MTGDSCARHRHHLPIWHLSFVSCQVLRFRISWRDDKGLSFPQAVTSCWSSMQTLGSAGVTVHISRTPEFWWWGRKDAAGEGERPRASRQMLQVNSCCHSWGFCGPKNLWRKESGTQEERATWQSAKRAPLTLPLCPDQGVWAGCIRRGSLALTTLFLPFVCLILLWGLFIIYLLFIY